MEVAYVLCARASTRAPWVPVPTTRRGSLDCATLSSSKSPWALNVLKGAKKDRDTCDATLVLKAFESDVRVRVASLTAADASPPSAKKPRLLESDSEPANQMPTHSRATIHNKARLAAMPLRGARWPWTRLVSQRLNSMAFR